MKVKQTKKARTSCQGGKREGEAERKTRQDLQIFGETFTLMKVSRNVVTAADGEGFVLIPEVFLVTHSELTSFFLNNGKSTKWKAKSHSSHLSPRTLDARRKQENGERNPSSSSSWHLARDQENSRRNSVLPITPTSSSEYRVVAIFGRSKNPSRKIESRRIR